MFIEAVGSGAIVINETRIDKKIASGECNGEIFTY